MSNTAGSAEGGSMGVAGALVLRPDAMPDGLEEGYGYREACTDLGVDDPPKKGVAVWALYAPKADGSGFGQLSVVTTLVAETELAISMWSDDIVYGLPELSDGAMLHMAEGWVATRYMTLHPVFAGLGWDGIAAMAIEHPPPDTSGGAHRPVRLYGRDDQHGLWTVGCEDCAWSQRVDDELLDNGADRLLAWHAAYPGETVDHMSAPPPHYEVAVPDYVEWMGIDRRQLVVHDVRTGLLHRRRRTTAFEVYETLDSGERLAPPEYLPKGPVIEAIADLWQWGLLVPADRATAGHPRGRLSRSQRQTS